jgi:hypothetical protein
MRCAHGPEFGTPAGKLSLQSCYKSHPGVPISVHSWPAHLLKQIPYEDVPHETIALPERVFDPNYERRALSPELYVPKVFG